MDDERHQAALDGVRGFAAFSVVLFHIGHWLDAPLASNSFLAVDLFFLLSGYVLTLAYDGRLAFDLPVGHFIVLRLVRLMPLVILGTMMSAVYVILRIHVKHDDLSISDLATAVVLGAVDLPYLTAPLVIGGNQAFPLNGPQFSLFLEVVINIVWASSAFLRNKWVACFIAIVCFGALATIGHLGGDTPETFISGFPRVGASFLGGIAIFHLDRALAPSRWWSTTFWICCVVTLATFYAPKLPTAYQITWIATVSPLLVLSGARTILRGRIRSAALFGGRLSYPIYILHYPVFVWINGVYQIIIKRRDIAIEGAALMLIITLVSFVVLKIYDEPVRNRINKWLKQSTASRIFRTAD
ncbi:acyltransferase [Methylobacterium sp. J-048]|uniref:acyltransferase family protein n=1 Tax=Methylobacterium sp. J-048 TaxID=2836635 RepID=UPI001FB959C7|nr:acyltransferase [Methylobacterium sp. J-048]MCJ2058298.1 acyltransferase [Methylobacterium sp. J-048]